MRPPSSGSAEFVIQGGGNSFASKQQELSALLSQAAKDCNKDQIGSSLSQTEMEILHGRKQGRCPSRQFAKQNRSEMRQYRGKESLFKRPEGPAPVSARKTIADYHRNPHKWVKYSLDDVRNEQMSDRSNAQAAFAFLKELKSRKLRERCAGAEDDESMDTTDPESDSCAITSTSPKFTTRIPFRKSSENRDKEAASVIVVEQDDKPVFRNSKIVLPEYVVGQKKERKIRKMKAVDKIDRLKQMKLSHLEEIDE